jgi:predicted anti-sigma-YlaC factor YlaD
MKCEEIRQVIPDLASGVMGTLPEIEGHLAECAACAEKLKAFRQTMALLDEWQAPEPSPYFDIRLQARLREEMAKPQTSWLAWFRRPVLAAALTVLMAIGIVCSSAKAAECTGRRMMWLQPLILCPPQNQARQWAICSLWKRITTCIPISICWMTLKCSTMSWQIRNH